MGGIVFWPIQGARVSYNDLKLPKTLALDTIYVQGAHSDVSTAILLEEFSIHGAIEAVARKQEAWEDRMYLWIQYEKWESAWNAVAKMHGRHVRDQDMEVMFSDRSINTRATASARYGNDIWFMK